MCSAFPTATMRVWHEFFIIMHKMLDKRDMQAIMPAFPANMMLVGIKRE